MLSILIPVWNQGRIVKENFSHLEDVLQKMNTTYEIIFIDDGSVDETNKILQDICKNDSHVTVLSLPHRGQHAALYEGFKIAHGDIVITMDADQKVDPGYIPQLLDKINEGDDIVVAWRAERPGLGLVRRWASVLINQHTNLVTRTRLHDHACSLKAYRGKIIKDNIQRQELKKFFSLWVVRYTARVGEVRVACRYKHPQDSSFTLKDLFKLFFDLVWPFHPRGGNGK